MRLLVDGWNGKVLALAIPYEMARSFENPYPKYSDAWEAWENGIDWKRRFEALMEEF
jgi:hypothetical protein